MNVPLLDLEAQYRAIKSKIDGAIAEVMASQRFILGPHVQACEREIANYSQCAFGVGMSSGTDALLACLMAEGIGPGDEVITTPYTFFATAGSIARLGARPVFVDIDPVTYNITATQIATKITNKTRAIIPVHLYGQMTDMDRIIDLASQSGLVVIEDAAQAIGSECRGRRAGSIGHYGCFSFFPSKNLGAAGDAGMVVTNDQGRAERLAILRAHGSQPKYRHKVIGGNFRLDALQAAIISAKLPHLDEWIGRRRQNADRYDRLFGDSGLKVTDTATFALKRWSGGAQIILPAWKTNRHIFNQYVIRVRRRDALKDVLEQKGIGTEVYYPVPLHLQECFAYLDHKPGEFPESETAAQETLALPIYPELSDAQAQYVVESIREFLN